MPYSIRLPDGTLVQNIPDDLPPEEAKRRIIAAGLVAPPPPPPAPETTVGGQVKEAFKGLVPGAVGLLESAATGASALLPDELEKAAREKIASIAGAAKAPFAAAPGYEQTVGRKLGEAVGSTAPFLAAGPFGLAGRVAAAGVGVGAGAGEARTRAEREKATEGERATATALGIIPGALEVFAPFRILSRIPEQEVLTGVQMVKRAALAGGEEAAQEAASGFAQNLIAKGVYKPEQELIEGLGEQAAYGGATGAIIQGVMDLALGRRARGAAPAEEDPIVKARREAAEKAAAAAEKAAAAAEKAAAAGVEEPKVRGEEEEAPPNIITSSTIKKVGFTRGLVHDGIVGKDITNPDDLEQVYAVLEGYKERPNANTKTVAKIDAFLSTLPARPTKTEKVAETPAAPPAAVEPPAVAEPPAAVEPPAVAEPPAAVAGTETTVATEATPTEPRKSYADASFEEQLAAARERTTEKGLLTIAGIQRDLGLGFNRAKKVVDAIVAEGFVKRDITNKRWIPVKETTKAEDVRQAIAKAGGVSPGVAGEPGRGAASEGVGGVEPSGVVSPVADVGGPAGREGQQSPAVTPVEAPAPAPAPSPAPATSTVESLEAEQQKLLTKAGKVPAVKSKARAKYDELQQQIDALNEKFAPRSVSEPPVIEGLDPRKERTLRIKRQKQINELRVLEQVRDKAEGNLYLAEITGNEEAKIRAADALEAARLVLKKANAAATRTYAQLFDLEKADFEAAVGEAYVEDLLATRAAKEKAAKEKAPDTTKLPYTLTTAEAVREEIEYELPRSLPEYKAYIEKYFNPDRTLRKNVKEEDAVREGQELLKSRVIYRSTAKPAIENPISRAELEKTVADIEKALGGSADITVLDDITEIDGREEPGSRAGAVVKGKIFLFRTGIEKGVEGQKTIFHELFHKGLSKLLSPAEYRATMLRLYAQSPAVQAGADAYLASKVGKEDTKGKSPEAAKILAVEEGLAEIAEQTKLAPSTLRQLGNFFARLADRFGMPSLARAIRTMGLDPLQAFIREAIQAGVGPSTGEGVTRFRTPKAPTIVGERPEGPSWLERQLGSNKIIGLRTQTMDSLAALSAKFSELYNGKVRDSEGNINPEFQLSRALDSNRFSLEMQREGMIVRGPNGLATVKELVVDDTNFTADELKNRFDLIQGQKVGFLDAIKAVTKSKTGAKKIDELLAGEREYQLYQNREELKESGKELKFFYTEEKAQALHDEFMANEEARAIAQMLDAVRFKAIDFLVDTGRWSAEKAAAMKEALGYIPFNRIDALDATYEGKGRVRGASAFKNLKKYEGSETKQISSPVEAFSGLMDWMVGEGMKTEASYRALSELALVDAAKRVGSRDSVKLNQRGAVVETYNKGRKEFYHVYDPMMVYPFVMQPPTIVGAVKAAQTASRVLRAGVTSMPPFVLKQIADDVTRIFGFSKLDNPVRAMGEMLLNFPGNWVRELRGKKSASLRGLEKIGVIGTFDFTDEGNVKYILEEGGLQKPGALAKVYRFLEAGAKASDLSTREAIYNQAKREGKDLATAESQAREIINFSRRGAANTIDYMIRLIPFFNAFARGFDKILLAAAGGKTIGASVGESRAVFWKRAQVMAAMGLTYALLMQDDDEYNNLPDHVRDRNIILPFNKEFVEKYGVVPAIPLPADLAFMFKAIPERVVQYYKKQGTDEERAAIEVLGELTKQGYDVFASPNLVPQVVRPIIENMVNYSFFLDRPLESQAQQQLRPYRREGMGTSESMKALSSNLESLAVSTGIEAFAVSPIKLENFVRGMLGSVAAPILLVGDAFVNPSRTDRPLHQTLAAQATGASAFMKDALSSKSIDDLYKLERQSTQAYNTLKSLEKDGDEENVSAHVRSYYGALSVREEVQSLMENIRDLAKAAREIDEDKSMSPEDRRAAINQLRVLQNEYSRRAATIRTQARRIQMEME